LSELINTSYIVFRQIYFCLFLIVCILLCTNDQSLFAQEAASSTTQILNSPEDTLPVLFTLALSPNQKIPANDTLPDYDFRMYDPTRKGPVDYANLGNLGTSARPLWFSPLPRIGFQTGFRAFDLYRVNPEDLQFYRHSRTYSHAYFSRGRTQRDGMSWIKLSRTFSKGLNFSIQYKTINNLGEYRFQRVKHGSLAAGIWWPVRKNYEFFLIYASNTFRQQDNGGITNPNFFGTASFNGAISVPVLLDDFNAKTQQSIRNLQFSQYFTMGRFKGNVLKAEHHLNLNSEIWKFSDINAPSANQTAEQQFYGNLLTDTRGLRNYVNMQRIDNTFLLNTLRKKKNDTDAGRVFAGLRHSILWLDQEPKTDSLVNNLFLTGGITIRPAKSFSLVTSGDLGLLANTGEYRLQGALKIGMGKAGILEAGLLSQRRPPDFVQTRLYSTSRFVWAYDFEKPIENTLSAAYTLPLIGFKATAQSHLVNQFIYFDKNGLPAQTAAALQVNQLLIQQNFKIGHFRSENAVALQQANRSDVLHLPTWFSKNSLYYSGLLSKKALLLTAGADFRINSAFQPDSYQPFYGQFKLQDTFQQKPYPWIDLFMAVKIQTFRLYFRFENIAPFWSPATDNLYLTALHPQNRATFRLGISWRFLDKNVETAGNSGNNNPGSSGPPGRGF
jgi:hypothetical protein